MSIETWLLLGTGILLAVAGVSRQLVLLGKQLWWQAVATGCRLGAAATLATVLVVSISGSGQWSPFHPGQVAISLALASLGVALLLSWRMGVDGASPILDMAALVLVVMGGLLFAGSEAALLSCVQHSSAFYAQWVLFILGSGSTVVGGSAALMLLLRRVVADGPVGFQLPEMEDALSFLRQAVALTVILLGAGLTIGVWWAWRSTGSLAGGDPREVWMAMALLISGMSLVAWELPNLSGRWAAGLALSATVVAVFCLFVLLDLRSFLGI